MKAGDRMGGKGGEEIEEGMRREGEGMRRGRGRDEKGREGMRRKGRRGRRSDNRCIR